MDDGINQPVSSSLTIEVAPLTPVLSLDSPDLSIGYKSSDAIDFDIRIVSIMMGMNLHSTYPVTFREIARRF